MNLRPFLATTTLGLAVGCAPAAGDDTDLDSARLRQDEAEVVCDGDRCVTRVGAEFGPDVLYVRAEGDCGTAEPGLAQHPDRRQGFSLVFVGANFSEGATCVVRIGYEAPSQVRVGLPRPAFAFYAAMDDGAPPAEVVITERFASSAAPTRTTNVALGYGETALSPSVDANLGPGPDCGVADEYVITIQSSPAAAGTDFALLENLDLHWSATNGATYYGCDGSPAEYASGEAGQQCGGDLGIACGEGLGCMIDGPGEAGTCSALGQVGEHGEKCGTNLEIPCAEGLLCHYGTEADANNLYAHGRCVRPVEALGFECDGHPRVTCEAGLTCEHPDGLPLGLGICSAPSTE